jgi:hypothetical protein
MTARHALAKAGVYGGKALVASFTRQTAECTETMKVILNIVGVLMMLMGTIWFLQGINILPGSFMTGQIRWAVYGGGTALAGLGVVAAARRRRPGLSSGKR